MRLTSLSFGNCGHKNFTPRAKPIAPTFIRRVTYSLTGLPPSFAEVEAFVQDVQPDAYERLVDRLLASPRYGEQLGRMWLDVARYPTPRAMSMLAKSDSLLTR